MRFADNKRGSACNTFNSVGAGSMASLLPVELWANVFSFLGVKVDEDAEATIAYVEFAAGHLKWFAQLQLVCRKFRAVLQTHPGIMSTVVLPYEFKDSLWSNLFEWTKGRTSSIHTFVADCTQPRLDIALAGLGSQQAELETAVCRECGSSSIHMLSMFSTLKSCTLSGATAEVDLSPLGTLSALCCLELYEGHFSSTMLPPNLLTLSVTHSRCVVDPAGLSMKNLQHLLMEGSRLSLLPSGIAACAGLQRLSCCSSAVRSSEAEHWLYTRKDRDFCVPAVISALTCLTYLSMVHDGPSDGPIDLSNIYLLKSLQHLRFQSTSSSVAVGHGLTALKRLEKLRLQVSNKAASGFDDVHDSAHPYIELKLDVGWAALAHLKHITIEGDVFRCRPNILELLHKTNLETVHFTHSRPGDTFSSTTFATLVYAMARCRPNVCLMLDTAELPRMVETSVSLLST